MRHRRRLAIAILSIVAVATFFLPSVYWRVVGTVKGEAFYHGRPTSWWEREIRTSYSTFGVGVDLSGPPLKTVSGWVREPQSPWYELLLPEPLRVDPWDFTPPLTRYDPKELAVLLELIRSDDPKVRLLAVWELGGLQIPVQFVWVAIREACDDPDADVRRQARSTLPAIKLRIEQRLHLNSNAAE